VLRKRAQKRRQQLTMVILLATISIVLLGILIFVLVFQAAKKPQAFGEQIFDRPIGLFNFDDYVVS